MTINLHNNNKKYKNYSWLSFSIAAKKRDQYTYFLAVPDQFFCLSRICLRALNLSARMVEQMTQWTKNNI